MKSFVLTCFLGSLLLGTSLVSAQTTADEHAGHHPDEKVPPATNKQPPAKSDDAAAMNRMRSNMKKLEGLMSNIHASKDGKERQLLLQQHSQSMHEQMDMMRGMAGGQGGMASGGMKMGDNMMTQMMTNHQAMQARMEMMEMMMEQMLEHQNAQTDATPAK